VHIEKTIVSVVLCPIQSLHKRITNHNDLKLDLFDGEGMEECGIAFGHLTLMLHAVKRKNNNARLQLNFGHSTQTLEMVIQLKHWRKLICF
jgi:hypothetical protein